MLRRTVKLHNTHSFFLFGPRGAGKTRLLKAEFLDRYALYVDLLSSDEFGELSLRPDSLKTRIEGRYDLKKVIIDEVQKVPALLDVVHQLIENNSQNLQFIITGSSARKLKRGAANLLAGRAFVYHLYPFTAEELGESFIMQQALEWGTFPALLQFEHAEDRRSYLRAYTDTYLREEVLQEQLIRKLGPFQRFLPIASQCSGTVLNFAKIGRDDGAAPQTVENYFHILQDTLIGFFLPAYHRSIRKQERQGSKFYLFDLGVMRAFSRELDIPLKPGTYAFGRAFEHFVIQEIYRLCSYRRPDDLLYYYQTHGGLEVDLVIDRPGQALAAIEIKSAAMVTAEHVRHLNEFVRTLSEAEAFCFSLDPHPRRIGRVQCLHWEEGLNRLGLLSGGNEVPR